MLEVLLLAVGVVLFCLLLAVGVVLFCLLIAYERMTNRL